MKAIIIVAFLHLFLLSSYTIAQPPVCAAPDITISSDVTWQNQTIYMEPDRRIIITEGATLTIQQCTLRRAYDCPGYWDGIYLITTEEGKKASLYVEESVIEFSQFGIQAPDGWEHIELVDTKMRDNGQMINVRDNWPFVPISAGGGAGEGGYEGCSNDIPAPKVIISDQCQMLVKETGNPSVDPVKQIRQVSVLGGELRVSNSNFVNGQSTYRVAAISASRGKCQIYGTRFEDFWTTIYKGSDAQALCNSEGLILTGSYIFDPQYWPIFNAPEFAIYNVSADMLVKGNIIEGNIRSEGIGYGGLFNNNIIKSDNIPSTVWIDGPIESRRIRDNKFYNSPTEYYGSNVKTDATCNTWEFVDYEYSPVAAVGGGDNEFPMSWGTTNKASSNVWESSTQPEMWDLSSNSGTLTYYYRDVTNETFEWFSIIDQTVTNSDGECTYKFPELLVDLDTTEFVLSADSLEGVYNSVDSLIRVIKSTSDTTQTSVQEIIADLERQLSDLVGKGLLFMDTTSRQFWTEKVNIKAKELFELNTYWYAEDMDTIKSLIQSHPDPDAQVLYDAANATLTFIDSSDLYSLDANEVEILDSIARSSYGDYTNIVRNFLYMVYDSIIPWDREDSVLDSMREAESFSVPATDNEFIPAPSFTVHPNPFGDNIEISKLNPQIADSQFSVEIVTMDGKVVKSSTLVGSSGLLVLNELDPGFYLVKIRNVETGIVDIHKVYKSTK